MQYILTVSRVVESVQMTLRCVFRTPIMLTFLRYGLACPLYKRMGMNVCTQGTRIYHSHRGGDVNRFETPTNLTTDALLLHEEVKVTRWLG